MQTYWGVEVKQQAFLTSVLVGGELLASFSALFTRWETDPGTHWTGLWVGPRAGLDAVAK
jgi:hypothetical protein